LKNKLTKLSSIKTLRLNKELLQIIEEECKNQNIKFSDFMRDAAENMLKRSAKSR